MHFNWTSMYWIWYLQNEQYSHRINYFQTQSTSYMYHADPVYASKMSSWQSHLSLYIYHDHLGMFILSSLSILPDPLDKSSRQESYMYWCFCSGAHALCTLFRFFFNRRIHLKSTLGKMILYILHSAQNEGHVFGTYA